MKPRPSNLPSRSRTAPAQLHLGDAPLQVETAPPCGELTQLLGEPFYRISNFDAMRPFFMSIVSDADHWMFISSTGGLTAGRRTADSALFPYSTDDKIHDSSDVIGSTTSLVVRDRGKEFLWTPFSEKFKGVYRTRRNLYKSLWGNKLVFEEINEDLSLAFRYGWFHGERFGFVRRCWLHDNSNQKRAVRVLDGIRNLMPSGIGSQFQLEKSTLLDAYKRAELVPNTTLGLFTLSSIPIDRPEPAEALRATVAWSTGLKPERILLSPGQLAAALQRSDRAAQAFEVRGERGAYILDASVTLRPGQTREWIIVADVDQSHAAVANLREVIADAKKAEALVLEDVERGTRELRRIVALADGMQASSCPLSDARHYANVTFNIMRGGVFADGCNVDSRDLEAFVKRANCKVFSKHAGWFKSLPQQLTISELTRLAAEKGDPQLERICREYLPLTFSRRHGDPSRPWNRFSIASRDLKGKRILNYEGNWRDIFQNWEALAVSFPAFAPAMVCKFVNASTADGYNPYRITRDGLDWETVDPHDPWSFIGYWGDHQIIYLLKLLEIVRRHEPGTLEHFLSREMFSFADVPYRIKDYAETVSNPKDTVKFDSAAHERAIQREQSLGSDGKLLCDRSGNVHLANFTEKLLIPVLAKLSNFVPDAGIWLNTQRPEWNDANNALVGNGASMVTLYQLRRHLQFLHRLFSEAASSEFKISEEAGALLGSIQSTLSKNAGLFCGTAHSPVQVNSDRRSRERLKIVDELGKAGSLYRQRIYGKGFSGRSRPVLRSALLDFLALALQWVDASISTNKRAEGLYESYNLIRFVGSGTRRAITIRRLYPMLEGQAAVLASEYLSASETLEVIQALRRSPLYRADQHSYILYPDRDLPSFLKKNQISAETINGSALLKKLVQNGNDDLIEVDINGIAHFNGSIRNEADLARKLDHLASDGYRNLVKREREQLLALFESLFDHETFTGRSGTFFAYEGLGSIYWHMVSKLLLSVQESCLRAAKEGAPKQVQDELAAAYYDIRAGLGDCKTPAEYGAFPMDSYSHTPKHKGASQPGLTGQVKEDILCRWGELGVVVENGRVLFHPTLLREKEFEAKSSSLHCVTLNGEERSIALPPRSLGFTYCQVPIIYTRVQGETEKTRVVFSDGTTTTLPYAGLDEPTSRRLFNRTGEISEIVVFLR